ncbi:DUF6281 family protein [Streptomyces sp. Je 1-369]|uniref:DUF6281 family protein n=1 Tax=Streptomyces sp. Je 1-369 TaxID=2966192 RepID=UPI00228691DB|nr:DUF6281 family protein [Streptomyces sp. Je 1-369]WAL99307.1 DUF6281 family protein [Streptomyces sp. Je 1-369]
MLRFVRVPLSRTHRASDEVPVKSTAYRVEGLAEDVAVAVGDTADEAELFAVRSGEGLPSEVKDLLDAR